MSHLYQSLMGQTVAMSLKDEFDRNGTVVLRGVVSPHELSLLTTGIDEVVRHPSPRAKVASTPDDPGFFIEDFNTWRDHPEFSEFVTQTKLSKIAAELTGSSTIRLYHDHVLVKEPGTRQRTPWHQDQPYYDVEGQQNVSFWIPVDPVAKQDCLELIAGTHRGPWLMPRSFLDHQAKWFPEGSLVEMPDFESLRDSYEILSWDLEPGDAIAFHMLTVHGAPGVSGTNRRRVFSLRVLGDDMVYAPRNWVTSPDMRAVMSAAEDQRVTGESLRGDWFPQLW
jgi:ectoine hydroxylase-related dioxygenase (phytanoyl-CoA dioxygenase family)